MAIDSYLLFTQCHRLYVQGVRRALYERLVSAYGDDWWEIGVMAALTQNQRQSIARLIDRDSAHDYVALLDTAHFGAIVSKHYATVFSDDFDDSLSTFKQFRSLAWIRNEWAHVQDMSIPRVAQVIEMMKSILASLRRREALEIDRVAQDQIGHLRMEVVNSSEEFPINGVDESDDEPSDDLSNLSPELWNQLQSCLSIDTSVEFESDLIAIVTVRITNTALGGDDRPEVLFKAIQIETQGLREHPEDHYTHYGEHTLMPSETYTRRYTCHPNALPMVQVNVLSRLDWERFFNFRRRARISSELIVPILNEFVKEFEAIEINKPITKVLDSIRDIKPTMTLADLVSIRTELGHIQPLIKTRNDELSALFSHFHLNKAIPPGKECVEIITLLRGLNQQIEAVNNAIREIDFDAISRIVNDLEQVQLAVLRIENTIKEMAAPQRIRA